MYYCIVCGQKMVWRCDYDPEDLGYTGAGIVNACSCHSCQLEHSVVCLEGEPPVILLHNLEEE